MSNLFCEVQSSLNSYLSFCHFGTTYKYSKIYHQGVGHGNKNNVRCLQREFCYSELGSLNSKPHQLFVSSPTPHWSSDLIKEVPIILRSSISIHYWYKIQYKMKENSFMWKISMEMSADWYIYFEELCASKEGQRVFSSKTTFLPPHVCEQFALD